jgi:hypothetical protein
VPVLIRPIPRQWAKLPAQASRPARLGSSSNAGSNCIDNSMVTLGQYYGHHSRGPSLRELRRRIYSSRCQRVKVIFRLIWHSQFFANCGLVTPACRSFSAGRPDALDTTRPAQDAAPGNRCRTQQQPRNRIRIRPRVPSFDFADNLTAVVSFPRGTGVMPTKYLVRPIPKFRFGRL